MSVLGLSLGCKFQQLAGRIPSMLRIQPMMIVAIAMSYTSPMFTAPVENSTQVACGNHCDWTSDPISSP